MQVDPFYENLINPIEVVVGKCYAVTPCYKKAVVETSFYRKDKKQFVNTVVWRSGTFLITPQNEDEVEMLNQSQYERGFEPYDFEENEFVECWDGCSEDQEFFNIENEDEQEVLRELWYNDGHGGFEDAGWRELDPEVYFDVPVLLEEFAGYEI